MTLKQNNPFPSHYEEFIYKSRYARWLEDDNRRENWDETVNRLIEFYSESIPDKSKGFGGVFQDLYKAIYNLDVLPSMRALMTAGPALERCNVAAYNCAYLPVDSLRSFDEAMYILMCGTGVGFSVERKYVEQLPVVAEEFTRSTSTIRVADSKEGWSRAFRELLALLCNGQIPEWDTSRVRPAGARLRTFGGRASGPEPLVDLFEFCIRIFQGAAGRRLSTLECHDIMCKVGDVVVVGGVRRSAMISLSDVTDDRLRHAKTGAWWERDGHRRLANNSAVYRDRRPDMELFFNEFKALYDSKAGERGIFSRYACQRIAGRNNRRNTEHEFGTNPCSEIILRPFEFCNLTEVVVRDGDTLPSLERKVRQATILGTIQSTFTNFKYLRKIWKDNCDEERLLGVSLTGICDNLSLLSDPAVLTRLRDVAIETNKEWADRLGIPASAAITCVKPSGTVSQLVNSASGMHCRHSPFYLRTVRADNKDPMTEFLKDQGVYNEPDIRAAQTTTVFYFPQMAPREAVVREGFTALDQLELWNHLQEYWCEHKPSCTVNVKDDEWFAVGDFVYKNFDKMSGISFLPHDGGTYQQAPYQEITAEEYEDWVRKSPTSIDWDRLQDFEKVDTTTGSQELACTGGVCEVINIGGISDG